MRSTPVTWMIPNLSPNPNPNRKSHSCDAAPLPPLSTTLPYTQQPLMSSSYDKTANPNHDQNFDLNCEPEPNHNRAPNVDLDLIPEAIPLLQTYPQA